MGSQDAKDLFWLLGGDQPADPSSLQASLIALGVALEPALHPPARNAKSRSEVLSGTPMTSEGRITLDPEPDVRETLLLADELDLDELVALRYIQAACERVRGPPCDGSGIPDSSALMASNIIDRI